MCKKAITIKIRGSIRSEIGISSIGSKISATQTGIPTSLRKKLTTREKTILAKIGTKKR
jgi:hypothetical protein